MKRIENPGLFVWLLVGLTSCQLTNSDFRTVGSGTLKVLSTGEVVDLERCLVEMPEPQDGSRDLSVTISCTLETDPFLEDRSKPGLFYWDVFSEAELEDMEGDGGNPLFFTYRDKNSTKRMSCEDPTPLRWNSDQGDPWSLRRMEFSVSSACVSGSFALIREEI